MYKIIVNLEECTGCEECANSCPMDLFEIADGKSKWKDDDEECTGCEACVSGCEPGAIELKDE
ncbi:MAG: Ferredoxin-3 [candidate division BRC1 bacterium ADurb.BinA364]|nr:MAG: Ferredoxin-3 [candidate division BRC1 bacterium ADurb.BinA364]